MQQPQTLNRYIFNGALFPSLAALGIMLCIVWLLQGLRLLDFVINKGVGLGTFLQLTSLLIPLLLTVILPLSLCAGVAYACKRVGEESELTALFSAGVSRTMALKPFLWLAVVAVLAGYALHMWILPLSTTTFKDLQYDLRRTQADILLDDATFNQLGPNLMVYLERENADGSPLPQAGFKRLLVHDTRTPNRPVTWLARRGMLQTDAEGQPQLLLYDGMQQQVRPGRVEMLEFAAHTLNLSSQLGETVFAPRNPEVEEYPFSKLWDGKPSLLAEAHKRLLWPLLPLPLALWAAANLLRVPGRQSALLPRILLTGAGALALVALLLGTRGAAEDGNHYALYGQWLLPLGLALISLYKLKTVRHG